MNEETFVKYFETAAAIKAEIGKAVLGKNEVIEKILTAVFAGGHILLDDIPGVGKTTMALAFSKATGMEYKRLQFTPDVLPTDVTGFSLYDKKTDSFVYKPGAAICNLFLADEINRTSSKTQSALLEIMEECRVTVDGITRNMPNPYVVIATQNPIGSVGTQMLPDSQLDRFMLCVSMGYPSVADEVEILKGRQSEDPLQKVKNVATIEDIVNIRTFVKDIYTDDKIYEYIANIADATRKSEMLRLGLSPRGSLALAKASRAVAFLHGRNYVLPDDVLFIFGDIAAHRIVLGSSARVSAEGTGSVLKEIIQSVPAPKIARGKK